MTTTTARLLESMRARLQRLVGERHVTLHDLDARALADIGISASEIASIDAEWRGTSSVTRLRIAPRVRHA
jgi:uncharacterized protein YjiS (DUF1127 family)